MRVIVKRKIELFAERLNGYHGKIAYWTDDNSYRHSRAGFLEKHITASATKYKLFDGKWLNLNNGGGVSWSEG